MNPSPPPAPILVIHLACPHHLKDLGAVNVVEAGVEQLDALVDEGKGLGVGVAAGIEAGEEVALGVGEVALDDAVEREATGDVDEGFVPELMEEEAEGALAVGLAPLEGGARLLTGEEGEEIGLLSGDPAVLGEQDVEEAQVGVGDVATDEGHQLAWGDGLGGCGPWLGRGGMDGIGGTRCGPGRRPLEDLDADAAGFDYADLVIDVLLEHDVAHHGDAGLAEDCKFFFLCHDGWIQSQLMVMNGRAKPPDWSTCLSKTRSPLTLICCEPKVLRRRRRALAVRCASMSSRSWVC